MLCQGLVKVGVDSKSSEDTRVTTHGHVNAVDSAACFSSSYGGSSGGILESIERHGGSVADDVNFTAVVQRIFTKTINNTQ